MAPSSETVAGVTDHSPAATWTESDELRLLRAVLEIALEPTEAFDPRVSLFARIEKNLGRPFTRAEIVRKVKELRRRYEERCCEIRTGENGGAQVGDGDGEVFDISHKVWGIGKTSSEKRKGKMGKRKRRKKKKVHIDKLLNVAKQIENELHPQKHFLAIISSSWGEKYHLECCQSRPYSQKGFCSSSSASEFFTNKSWKLTKNIDLVALNRSSKLVLTALNDVSQKHHGQREELIDKSNQYQEPIDNSNQHQGLIDMSNQILAQPFTYGIDDFLSHGPETPPHADEANGQTLQAESSTHAEKRLRLYIEACTEGKGRAWAPSAFSLCSDDGYQSNGDSWSLGMNKSVSDPVRHEYPKIQGTAEPYHEPGLDMESFQPSYRPVMGFNDLSHFNFDPQSDYLFDPQSDYLFVSALP